MSNVCTSQSHVWPSSGAPPVRAGSAANDEHSSGGSCAAASRALAANRISVRTLMARMSSSSTPAPSAMPWISSRYFAPCAAIGARKRTASSRTFARSQRAQAANTSS